LRKRFNKIAFKLIIVVGITTILIISIYSYFNLRAQSRLLFNEFERHANQLSETIKKSTRLGMLKNQREQIYEIINTIGEEENIREIRIFNKEGVIIYSNNPKLIGKMVNIKGESCYACHQADKPLEKLPINRRTRVFRLSPNQPEILGVMNPIYNEPSCWRAKCHVHPRKKKVLGVLDITMSLNEVAVAQRKSAFKLLIFAVSAIVSLSLIIIFFVKRWLDNPIKTLLEATRQVGTGNLNYTVKDLGDNELGALALAFNSMTKKLAEARLQLFQSDKMASLGRLAAGVAHEINNPLTAILTYSSFLQKRVKKDSELYEELEVIVRETKRSRDIVRGLLDFARQSVPRKNKAMIDEIIDNAITVLKNQLSLKKIKLDVEIQENIPEITVDSNQLQQVFINLLVNSIDALGEGGEIKISVKKLIKSPKGVVQIRSALCKNRHSLIDDTVKLEGLPTIKVKTEIDGREEFVNLDPIYGLQRHIFKFDPDVADELHFSCPKCNASLMDEKKKCPECGASVFLFEVPPKGLFESCSNLKCKWQRWEFVDSEGDKNYLEIQIEDNGIGIGKNDLPKIFDPFFTTKGQKGTGLGLAVVWGIIDNHNGTIKVESIKGKGTKFTINIPIE